MRNLEVLKEWRDLRETIKNKNTMEKLKGVVNFWAKQGIVNYVLDYDKPETWPTTWELISDGFYDQTALSYLMSETLFLANEEPELILIKIIKTNEILLVVSINDYILNYSYNDIVHKQEITQFVKVIQKYKREEGKYYVS